jgi:hypothetical protein
VIGGLHNIQHDLSPTDTSVSHQSEVRFGDSSLSYRGGIAVLRCAGEPHQIGAAHGRLLASAMIPFSEATYANIHGLISTTGWVGSWFAQLGLDWRLRFLDDGLADSDRRMLAGMVRGAQASGTTIAYRSMVHAAAAIDIGEPSPRTAESDVHVVARTLSLVTTLANDPTRLWLANTFSLPGLDEGGQSLPQLVTIARPTGKIAWASAGWPGFAGVMVGLNAAGIAIAVHPVRSGDVRATRAARPTAMLARLVLETATTLDEAVAAIKGPSGSNSLGAAAFVIIDGNSGKSIVVERTPDTMVVSRQAAAVTCDTLQNPAFTTDPQNERARRQLTSTARCDRASRLLRTPPADVGALAGILRDHRTADDVPRPLGHRSTIADVGAVNTVIIDPKARTMWVADKTAAGQMRGFDLRADFALDAAVINVIGAPDLASDPEAQSGLYQRVTMARQHARSARGSLAIKQYQAASDWIARGLAIAPELPELSELAAIIAAANGDSKTAKAFAQAWFDNGADNPAGEERLRAIIAR